MANSSQSFTDTQVERIIGNLLWAGVVLAALVVAFGGILYLVRHGAETPDLRVYRGEPMELRSPAGVVRSAWAGNAGGVIQLGLLLLIATPVARVIFSMLAFAAQRDLTYVALTLIVLTVLLYSLFFGHS